MAEAALFVLVQIPFWVDVDPVDNDADMQMSFKKIGRASCRERV